MSIRNKKYQFKIFSTYDDAYDWISSVKKVSQLQK